MKLKDFLKEGSAETFHAKTPQDFVAAIGQNIPKTEFKGQVYFTVQPNIGSRYRDEDDSWCLRLKPGTTPSAFSRNLYHVGDMSQGQVHVLYAFDFHKSHAIAMKWERDGKGQRKILNKELYKLANLDILYAVHGDVYIVKRLLTQFKAGRNFESLIAEINTLVTMGYDSRELRELKAAIMKLK